MIPGNKKRLGCQETVETRFRAPVLLVTRLKPGVNERRCRRARRHFRLFSSRSRLNAAPLAGLEAFA